MNIQKIKSEPKKRVAVRLRGRPKGFDRAAVLEKAMLTFWRYGYEGTSIPDLTREMGISAQSLYATFQSKGELYKEAMTLYRSSTDYIDRAFLDKVNIWAAVRRVLLESAERFTRAGSPAGCMLSGEMLQYSSEHEPIAEFVRSMRSDALGSMAARLRGAVQQRQLCRDTDVDGLARSIYAVVLGMAVQARDGASEQQLRSVAELSCAAMQHIADPRAMRRSHKS